jgi:hypothetical protein
MLQDSVISAMSGDVKHDADYISSLKEQVLRLQSLIAYLLEKNEQLRARIQAQSENG